MIVSVNHTSYGVNLFLSLPITQLQFKHCRLLFYLPLLSSIRIEANMEQYSDCVKLSQKLRMAARNSNQSLLPWRKSAIMETVAPIMFAKTYRNISLWSYWIALLQMKYSFLLSGDEDLRHASLSTPPNLSPQMHCRDNLFTLHYSTIFI